MLRISNKRLHAAAVAVACAVGVGAGAALPATAAAATKCITRAVSYTDPQYELADKLTAEVCRHGDRLSLVESGNSFDPYGATDPNQQAVVSYIDDEDYTGDGVHSWFWDPYRYGGSWTIWADVHVTMDLVNGGLTEEYAYLRIWVKPNGHVAGTYAGL